jgi:hypothetical protein
MRNQKALIDDGVLGELITYRKGGIDEVVYFRSGI